MDEFLRLVNREVEKLRGVAKMDLVLLLGAASFYVLLIGNLYSGEIVQNIPLAVCDLDNSSYSRQLTTEISMTDQLVLKSVVSREQDAEQLMLEKKVLGYIMIPQGFARDIANGKDTQVAYVSNSSNNIHSNYAKSPVSTVVGTFGAQLKAADAMSHGRAEVPASLIGASIRYTQNQTQSYAVFYIYGIMMAAAQVGLTISFGSSFFDDKLSRSFKRFGVVRLLAAKEFIFMLLFHVGVSIGSFFINSFLHLPYKPLLLPYLIMVSAFGFCLMNLTALLALYFRTKLALLQCLTFYTLPAFLSCGYIWPNVAMVPIINFLSHTLPLHYLVIDLRNMFTSGNVPAFGVNVLLLTCAGAVMMVLAIWLLKRQGKKGFQEEWLNVG